MTYLCTGRASPRDVRAMRRRDEADRRSQQDSAAQYLRRDKSSVRTRFILELLNRYTCTGPEIEHHAEKNGLGFAAKTYLTDLHGLVLKDLIYCSGRQYYITTKGKEWLQCNGTK